MWLSSFSKRVPVNLEWFGSWNSRFFQFFVGTVTFCPWFTWELCDSATPMHWYQKRKGQVRNVDGNWKSWNGVFVSLLPRTFQPALSTGCLPGVLPFCYSHWLPEKSSFHQASSFPSFNSLKKICSFPGYHGSLWQSCFLAFVSLKTKSKYRTKNL